MGIGVLAPRPGRFTPWKETRYKFYRRLGGPQGLSRPHLVFFLRSVLFMNCVPLYTLSSNHLFLQNTTQISMSPAGFEPSIPARERPQTFDPRTFQAVASRYTVYAIPYTVHQSWKLNRHHHFLMLPSFVAFWRYALTICLYISAEQTFLTFVCHTYNCTSEMQGFSIFVLIFNDYSKGKRKITFNATHASLGMQKTTEFLDAPLRFLSTFG
jgi:hypothetical protein